MRRIAFEATIVDVMGNDLSVVNAARASFMKEAEYLPGFKLAKADEGLIRFLGREPHESPFRHAAARFKVKTSLRHRLRVESVLGNNRLGFVFKPSLYVYLSSGANLSDQHEWRITGSLAGFVRLFQRIERLSLNPSLDLGPLALNGIRDQLAPYFPFSMEALAGFKTDKPHSIQPARGNSEMVNVLDKGYVRLVDWMDGLDDEERVVSFEIKAPLMIRSQWFKYRRNSEHTPQQYIPIPWEELGSGNGDDGSGDPLYARNEASRRYVTLEPEFYIPEVWRSAPENRKQGSGGPVNSLASSMVTNSLRECYRQGLDMYETAMSEGIAPEQARLFLPSYALYTTWRWTANMDSVGHFLRQRLDGDAQSEIRDYAEAVRKLVNPVFPKSVERVLSTWQ